MFDPTCALLPPPLILLHVEMLTWKREWLSLSPPLYFKDLMKQWRQKNWMEKACRPVMAASRAPKCVTPWLPCILYTCTLNSILCEKRIHFKYYWLADISKAQKGVTKWTSQHISWIDPSRWADGEKLKTGAEGFEYSSGFLCVIVGDATFPARRNFKKCRNFPPFFFSI
jgi:hypothetical protein